MKSSAPLYICSLGATPVQTLVGSPLPPGCPPAPLSCSTPHVPFLLQTPPPAPLPTLCIAPETSNMLMLHTRPTNTLLVCCRALRSNSCPSWWIPAWSTPHRHRRPSPLDPPLPPKLHLLSQPKDQQQQRATAQPMQTKAAEASYKPSSRMSLLCMAKAGRASLGMPALPLL